MRWNSAISSFLFLLHGAGVAQCFIPSPAFHSKRSSSLIRIVSQIPRPVSINVIDNKFGDDNGDDGDEDEDDDDDDDDEDESEDPYTKAAESEFTESEKSSLSTLSGSSIDWGGALGQLRQRVGDIESGKSQDPSNALFRLMSAKTPNQLIGTFVSSANPKVVKACADAVNSLLGGLSSPAMGVETIAKTNGEKIGSLCFQLQMTGYMFRNAEYVMALKEMMNIRGSVALQDYKDAFDRLDSDHSGFVEAKEVRTLFDEVYEGKAPKFEVEAFLKFFDTNQDGKISWPEFERGLGAAMARETKLNGSLNLLPEASEDDDDVLDVEPEVSGEVEIELECGKVIKVEAKEYIKNLKSEAEALKQALIREKLGSRMSNGGIIGATPGMQDDFGGIAQYIASRQGNIKALTEGIQPEIVETMKMLVDFVLEGGDSGRRKDVPKEQLEMELPGSALQQLALWQLVLGYRLREAEATGEYLKLLE